MSGVDGAMIELIARRVAELLREEPPVREPLIDAAELARRLGVARSTIYDRATELGAIRFGCGPRPRLRFDPRTVEAAIAPRGQSSNQGQADRRMPPCARRRRSAKRGGDTTLLPIRGALPR